MAKMGRPTDYSDEMAEKIINAVIDGDSIRKFCRNLDIDPQTLYNWLDKYPEFFERYTKAREIRTDLDCDELVEIARAADETVSASVNKARLVSDNMKWIASKRMPKTYGDKQGVELDVKQISFIQDPGPKDSEI